MPTEAPTIRELPESVALRLHSTLTVTTLCSAISELVQNSLDAQARNIKIQANLSRNSCVVEDDGVGISPIDVSMVGKMYATSKYPPSDSSSSANFGLRGQALSSLATHSMFTLTSRHRAHRSTHTVRISYATPVFTGLAPEHLRLSAPGTVVRIEGLWGDMPVRLKARQQDDVEREWEDVNRTIVQLLLTPQGKGVGLIARDESGSRRLAVKDTHIGPWEMGVLRQAYGREVVRSGWEKVRAQQGGVGINGWICTKGNGTRGFQFLYINNHPLPPSTTLLHSEINRILAASSFGIVEEDGRSKARSGPNKGMFILHIECADREISVLGGEGGTEGKAGLEGDYLQAVINLLQKLLREFLKTHHFQPSSFSSTNPQEKNVETKNQKQTQIVEFAHKELRSRSGTPLGHIKNNSRPGSKEGTPPGDTRALAMWSRVKSARTDLEEEEGRQRTGFGTNELKVPSSRPASSRISISTRSTPLWEREGSAEKDGDEYVAWVNPVSKKSFQVNTRTGNTTSSTENIYRRSTRSSLGTKRTASVLATPEKPLGGIDEIGHAKKPRVDESSNVEVEDGFIEQLLTNWKNPVFEPTAAPIPSLTTGAQLSSTDNACVHDCPDGFVEATSTSLGKFTKEGLRNAQVIAQVDKKYILIKMHGISTDNGDKEQTSEVTEDCELLVIVDQHAADERIRVESLFAEICRSTEATAEEVPASKQDKLVFRINKREAELMRRYDGGFREWGVKYHVSSSGEEFSLHIDSLPRVAMDRCTNEPALAIEMIRAYVYTLSDQLAASHAHTHTPSSDWVKRIGSCPKGLLDMLNSRACRSAIMFNDPLELEECKVLINRLGNCMFPFQCAHGRPSMIPLVDLGVSQHEVGGLDGERGGGFARDFQRWMMKSSE